MVMPTGKIGESDFSDIGYGAMGLSTFYYETLKFPTASVPIKVLDAVLESGYNHIDTANVHGESEELIEVWLQDDIFLATKFGMVLGGLLPDCRHVYSDPEYVTTAIHRSLKLLQQDHVDLWYLHCHALVDRYISCHEYACLPARLLVTGILGYQDVIETGANVAWRSAWRNYLE